MRILATFVRKKHSLRWRQPKLLSVVFMVSLCVFCWSCSQAPPSLLPPERVASLNFSWCKTSDSSQTSAIFCSFKVELWIVFAETIKQWLITLILPEAVFELVSHSIGKVFSIFKKLNWRKTDPWSSCEDRFAWPLRHEEMGVHSWDVHSNKGDSAWVRGLPSAPLLHWLLGGGLHSQDGTWNHTCRDL